MTHNGVVPLTLPASLLWLCLLDMLVQFFNESLCLPAGGCKTKTVQLAISGLVPEQVTRAACCRNFAVVGLRHHYAVALIRRHVPK